MKYLITGGSGFIGYHLANYLSNQDKNTIYIADNFSRGKFDKDFNLLSKKRNVKVFKIDLLKNLNRLNNIKFDYVFHFAAIVGVANVLNNPYKTLKNNILITYKMLDFLKDKKIKKFCFTSSSEVYSQTLKKEKKKIPTPENIDLLIEKDFNERSSYYVSKVISELAIKFSHLPFVVFRPHNIFGPRMGSSHVIPELIKKIRLLKNNQQLIVKSPNHSRSFCYIDDAIKLIHQITHQKKTSNKIFNIGSQVNEIKILKLSKLIAKMMNKKLNFKKGTNQLGSPFRRVPLMSKTNKFVKIKQTRLKVGLSKTVDWYLKNE